MQSRILVGEPHPTLLILIFYSSLVIQISYACVILLILSQ